jgi:hypothetical protein
MVFAILYLLSFPLILYENFFSMRNVAEKSGIARSPFLSFFVAIVTYGSIAGLLFTYGWKIALFTFLVSWSFNKYSFRVFFRKYIYLKARRLVRSDWFEPGLSVEDRLRKAYEFAETSARQNATGK